MDPQTQLPVFKSIQIQLACQACIDAEKAHECVHLQHLIPRWQVLLLLRVNVICFNFVGVFCKFPTQLTTYKFAPMS